MTKKHQRVQIGRIFQLEMWPGQYALLAPIEISRGCMKGCVVTYVFRPGKDAAELARTATIDDLLFPPTFLPRSEFTDGVSLTDTGYALSAEFQPYVRHIFSAGGFFATDGEPVEDGVYPEWDMCVSYVDGLTYEIARESGLEPNESGIEKLFRQRLADSSTELSETSVNSTRAMLKISIPYDQLGNGDSPLHEVNDLADELAHRFVAGKIGTLDGDGYDALAADIFFMIKPKRYPDAVQEARRYLQEKGIDEYSISGLQLI
ncbi:hypothetical protein IT575_05170 [bacterium]|nr:hypothetical protein [bacterium]